MANRAPLIERFGAASAGVLAGLFLGPLLLFCLMLVQPILPFRVGFSHQLFSILIVSMSALMGLVIGWLAPEHVVRLRRSIASTISRYLIQ